MFNNFMISSDDLKNLLINWTYEPLLVILVTAIPFALFVISLVLVIFICAKERKEKLKLKPVPKTIKDDGKKERISDDHLIVTSNINEKRKIFDKSGY